MANELTSEQIAQAVQREKQAGFIVHSKDALGLSDEQIKVAHAKYLEQDGKRQTRLEGARNTILGKK